MELGVGAWAMFKSVSSKRVIPRPVGTFLVALSDVLRAPLDGPWLLSVAIAGAMAALRGENSAPGPLFQSDPEVMSKIGRGGGGSSGPRTGK
ncbi:hypothetical protein FKM82_027846 [Ascaphus truei]